MALEGSIKLLHLLPGRGADEIRVQLHAVRLCDTRNYNTLSYVWGDTSDQRSIIASGRAVNVTKNLFHALRRLRDPAAPITLWVDQLCIDLGDSAEKARQINLMRDIYKTSTQCWIWLGELPQQPGDHNVSHVEGALDFIRLCALCGDDSKQEDVRIPDSLSTPEQRSGARRALETFFSNPWWQRIWTVQEVVLPNCAVVKWGSLSISWKVMEAAAYNLCSPRTRVPPLELFEEFGHLIDDLTGPVRGLQIAKQESDVPLNLLQRWRERKATDPRDKVYGLMGLLQPTALPLVTSCDYNISTSSLYSKVTASLILAEKSLRPLVGARVRATPRLPSWAIDFAIVPDMKTSAWWWNSSHKYKWFTASYDKQPHLAFLQRTSLLELHGTFLGTILHVGGVLKRRRGENVSKARLIETIQSWERQAADFIHRLASTSEPCGTSSAPAWEEQFWRAMFSDLIVDEFPLRRGDASHITQLKEYCHLQSNVVDRGLLLSLADTVPNRALFITQGAYIGTGPADTHVGDSVWILQGGNVPFVLRASKCCGIGKSSAVNHDAYTLIGEAFVYGVMDGEVALLPERKKQILHIH